MASGQMKLEIRTRAKHSHQVLESLDRLVHAQAALLEAEVNAAFHEYSQYRPSQYTVTVSEELGLLVSDGWIGRPWPSIRAPYHARNVLANARIS